MDLFHEFLNQTPASANEMRFEELLRLPVKDRIQAIASELESLPREVSDGNVFHHKALLRMWDAARMEAGIVTPAEVQRENSPVTREQMTTAILTFRPRLRA